MIGTKKINMNVLRNYIFVTKFLYQQFQLMIVGYLNLIGSVNILLFKYYPVTHTGSFYLLTI